MIQMKLNMDGVDYMGGMAGYWWRIEDIWIGWRIWIGAGVTDMDASRHKRRGLGIEMGEGVVWLYQLWQFP